MESKTFETIATPLRSVKEIEEGKPSVQDKPLRSEGEKLKNQELPTQGTNPETEAGRNNRAKEAAEDYLQRILEDKN